MSLDVIQEFRDDHRWVRDNLLQLADALAQKDYANARRILGEINEKVGPHFRYEEEAMYPVLKKFLGEYIDQLIEEHDGAITTARACAALLSKDSLTDEEAQEASKAARYLLIHVSNCDGLAIISERLSQEDFDYLAKELERCRAESISLLDWAAKIRTRKVA